MSAASTSSASSAGPWRVASDSYRKKRVYVVYRLVGRKVEYALSAINGRKARYFSEVNANRVAEEMNATGVAP